MKLLSSMAVLLTLATPSLATDMIIVNGAESTELGSYLMHGEDRPLSVFPALALASGAHPAELSSSRAECLRAWAPVVSSTEAQDGEGVDASLLGTTEDETQYAVIFDSRPPYHREENGLSCASERARVGAFGGVCTLIGFDASDRASDVAAGEAMYADGCAQCHGRTGRGMASFPSLVGKEADYIADMLGTYRAGERVGPNSALMWPPASDLTDEDIADLSAFIADEFQ